MSEYDSHAEPNGGGMLELSGSADVSAEINTQVATARRYPRRPDKVISHEITGRATLNDEVATECMYGKPVGGQQVTGPSARFAEIVFASFGNLRVAARFVRIDKDDPERQAVIVEAVCLDLQSNNARIVPVRRSIMSSGKSGKRPTAYNAELTNTTAAAAASIAAREAILKVVPKSIWIEAYQRVVAVIRGDQATLGERRAKAIEAFGKFGVKPADLFTALGVKDESEIGLDMMPHLAGMWSALKEGEPVASVLGRAEAQHTPSPAVKNPLANDQPVAEMQQRTEAVAEQRATRADVELEKADVTSQARAEPQDKLSGTAMSDGGQVPQANGGAPQGHQGEGYIREAKRIIELATVASQLRNWWGGQREVRTKSGLSAVHAAELLAAYQAKYTALTTALQEAQ